MKELWKVVLEDSLDAGRRGRQGVGGEETSFERMHVEQRGDEAGSNDNSKATKVPFHTAERPSTYESSLVRVTRALPGASTSIIVIRTSAFEN